jgi:hypothetical protein
MDLLETVGISPEAAWGFVVLALGLALLLGIRLWRRSGHEERIEVRLNERD